MTNPYYNHQNNVPPSHTLGRSSTINGELEKIEQAFDLVTTLTISSVSPALTGTPTVPTLSLGDASTKIANGAVVMREVGIVAALKANIESPVLTGIPQSPTAAPGTLTDQIATTQFATTAVNAMGATKTGLASPAFTGVPTAPTASPGIATTQIATTQFVASTIASVNAQTALAVFVVTATTVSVLTSGIYVLTNASATNAVLPPAPAPGTEIIVAQTNGLRTNSYDTGAQSVTGSTGTASGTITMDDGKTARLKYINNTVGWVIL